MASRFGEMLLNRRRELGMSIQQVANVIKIRPQIIEFFETGNFASMPPRGYAQGMIASYARYLGLNPREVVNAYFDELYIYERGGSASGSQFTEGATNPVPRSVSTSGRYLMVDPPSSSRYGQRPQQAGYVSDSTTGHQSLRVAESERRAANLQNTGTDLRPLGPSYADDHYRNRGTLGSARPAADRTVRMGRPSSDPAETRNLNLRGRGSGRPGYGAPNRGRSQNPSRGGRGAGARVGARRGSAPSGLASLDPRFLMGGIAAIVVVLILIIFLLVRGCSSSASQGSDTTPASSSVVQDATTDDTSAADDTAKGDDTTDGTDTTDDTTDEDNTDADATDADADATADGEDTTGEGDDTQDGENADQPAEPVETVVAVSVDDKVTSWIEIKVDGQVVYGAQTAGPFEKEFRPTESIEITVDHPGDVHVTENGETVDWDTRTSGIGRVSISVPQPQTDDTATDGEATDGTDTTDDIQTDESGGTAE